MYHGRVHTEIKANWLKCVVKFSSLATEMKLSQAWVFVWCCRCCEISLVCVDVSYKNNQSHFHVQPWRDIEILLLFVWDPSTRYINAATVIWPEVIDSAANALVDLSVNKNWLDSL